MAVWIKVFLQGIGIAVGISYLFYCNKIAFLILLPFAFYFPILQRKNKKKKRQEQLNKEFKNPRKNIDVLKVEDKNEIEGLKVDITAPDLSSFISDVEFLPGKVLYPTINAIIPIGIFIKNIKCQLK